MFLASHYLVVVCCSCSHFLIYTFSMYFYKEFVGLFSFLVCCIKRWIISAWSECFFEIKVTICSIERELFFLEIQFLKLGDHERVIYTAMAEWFNAALGFEHKKRNAFAVCSRTNSKKNIKKLKTLKLREK